LDGSRGRCRRCDTDDRSLDLDELLSEACSVGSSFEEDLRAELWFRGRKGRRIDGGRISLREALLKWDTLALQLDFVLTAKFYLSGGSSPRRLETLSDMVRFSLRKGVCTRSSSRRCTCLSECLLSRSPPMYGRSRFAGRVSSVVFALLKLDGRPLSASPLLLLCLLDT